MYYGARVTTADLSPNTWGRPIAADDLRPGRSRDRSTDKLRRGVRHRTHQTFALGKAMRRAEPACVDCASVRTPNPPPFPPPPPPPPLYITASGTYRSTSPEIVAAAPPRARPMLICAASGLACGA